ncbi:hypothetical protein [Nocardia puris]|uniref:hypothetical protein n=1 Tax=Nocardia puris TaxID=208602 RepID=UPI002E2139AE
MDTADKLYRTRLRLLIAEATGDWAELLSEARQLKLGHELLGLVTARYARSRALEQKFKEADALWDEAVGDACLAQRWSDASTWIFSRRGFRARWKLFSSDELLPIERAIREMGPASRIIETDESAYQQAMEDIASGKLRSAAISAQRALRDAVVTSDWVAEEKARRVLASVLIESNEPERAAQHLAQAAAVEQIEHLATTFPNRFIDVVGHLDGTNYWTVGAAYRAIAKQADLVPEEVLAGISRHILTEFAEAEQGALVDMRISSSSRYQGAVQVLAGISSRIGADTANAALEHFERQPVVGEHHYRLHDKHEAIAVARFALRYPALRIRAITHLVALLARSEAARNSVTFEAIESHIGIAKEPLTQLASEGNRWAQETLAAHFPDGTSMEVAEAALERLVTPLSHRPNRFTVGTHAVGDSLLVSALGSTRLVPAIAELLRRAQDPHVGDRDRGDYLIAAANIAPHIDEDDRQTYLHEAMLYASSPTRSQHDELNKRLDHALGTFRITSTLGDSRQKALYLAACLATSSEQRTEIRNQTFAVLGEDDTSDYWSARTLQKLGDTLRDDIGFLSAQSWPLRSLAAILWVKHGRPIHVGERLAKDDDVRVRRVLADALASSSSSTHQTAVHDILANDPAFSVRAKLSGDSCP